MTTIAEMRDELADVLDGITGWRANGFLGDTTDPPVFKVRRLPFDPRLVFSGAKQRATYRATAILNRSTGESGERTLEALADPTSATGVVTVVQTSGNWSVTLDYAQVVQIGEVVADSNEGGDFLTVAFDIEIGW